MMVCKSMSCFLLFPQRQRKMEQNGVCCGLTFNVKVVRV